MSKLTGSKKATQFTESVIREMTRLNHLYGGVNLSQGFPDFPAPDAVKAAACAAIVEAGGTITHHHGVGRDHAPYMRGEVGQLGLETLRAVKERLDPAGVMNPGKLLP